MRGWKSREFAKDCYGFDVYLVFLMNGIDNYINTEKEIVYC